jgi:RNA polymerase sigma-70 factor (ECF subfamily)
MYRAFHPTLVAFASRYVGDAARADELVQDLFLDLWRKRSTWTVQGSVRSYLFSAVRNHALNVRRRDGVERDWAGDEAHDDVRALHAPPVSPDAMLDADELRERLASALAALPERCAIVMQLRWREGLSHQEIAEVMGISSKGVENELARGLRAVRQRMLCD